VQRRRRRGSGGGGRATAGDALRGRPRSPSSWAVTRAKTEAPSAAAEESLAKTVEAAAVAAAVAGTRTPAWTRTSEAASEHRRR